jgi:hypothetical protein
VTGRGGAAAGAQPARSRRAAGARPARSREARGAVAAAEMQRRAARWDERVRQDGTHDRNLTMTPLLNHVMSRGSVTLWSADPHDAP